MKGKERKIQTFHHEGSGISQVRNGKLRVAAYCRVSTLNEEQELSFETQKNYYTQLLTSSEDKVLAGIYADHGLSGLHMNNRTELQRLLEDCRKGKIDMVITKSVSRFSRNMAECQRTVAKLRQMGIRILFEKENIDTSDPSSEFFLSILASLAQEESNSISQNIRWAHAKNAEAGTPVRMAPYGYRRKVINGKKSKEWIIEKSEAEMVRKAFELADDGLNYKRISEALNKLEDKRNPEHRIWRYERLYAMFQNEVYKGDVLTNKHVKLDFISNRQVKNRGEQTQFYIEEHHEPIVSPELFDRVCSMAKNGTIASRRERWNKTWRKC